VADATNFARELGDTPANSDDSHHFSQAYPSQSTRHETQSYRVGTKARIEKERFGMLLGVAQGSAEPPRVIIMEYKGANKSKKPLMMVGKGLTFDSGGISLKPGAGMEEMKYDMCGGANVIGAMFAIAGLRPEGECELR
jgi:leucyl aminopeptidase